MTIKTWSGFSKRRNSTKQPTGGSSVTVTLKDGTSIESPTFLLSGNDFTIDYVEAFGHYYFVRDITSVRNELIEISCVQDILATYKSAITGSSQFVERADLSSYVSTIADGLNPPTDEVEIKSTNVLDTGLSNFSNPQLILGTVSDNGVAYYSMDDARLKMILSNVFNANFFQNWNNMFYGLRECLISLKKVPYVPTGTTESVYFGEYDTQDTATRVSSAYVYKSANVLINRPSDDHEAGTTYLDFSPYSMCYVYLPYVGIVPVDMNILGDTRYLNVEMWLDQQTADLVYLLSTDGHRIASYSGNCGANMPIATQNYNAMGVAGGLLSVVGGVLGDNPAMAGAGVFATMKELSAHSQVNGVISSYIGGMMGEWVVATVVTKVPVDWNLDLNKARCGLPVFKTMALSGISGYVQCKNASVANVGFEEDRRAIEEFLNSGLYIE